MVLEKDGVEINWTYRVRNEVLHGDKDRNILNATKKWQGNWIGHNLRRNCFLKHVTVGVLKVRGRKRKQLLNIQMLTNVQPNTVNYLLLIINTGPSATCFDVLIHHHQAVT
jgi:hypothetical protein